MLPRITIVAVMVFFPVMVNTIRGLTEVEPAALELMDSYAASEVTTLRKLRIPNALPYWFTALRIATTLSVIGAVVGEFFGGPFYSLGIYITNQTGRLELPERLGRDRPRLRARDRVLCRGRGAGADRGSLAGAERNRPLTACRMAYDPATGMARGLEPDREPRR